MLGAADADLLFGAIDAVAAGDARSALLAAARLADSGRDIGRFFGDLEAHARALMIVQTLGGEVPPELSVTAEQDERLREQAARVSPTDVVRVLDLIAVGLRAMKDGSDARTQLELALVKAAVPKVDASAKALQSRLERLEAGRPAPAPRAAGRAERGRPGHRRRPRRPDERRAEGGRPSGRARRGAASGRRLAARPSGRPLRARPFGGPHPASLRSPPSRSSSLRGRSRWSPRSGSTSTPSPSCGRPCIESIQAERPLLAEHLKVARPSALGNGELTLAWAETAGLSKRKAEDAANRELIVRAIRAVTGAGLRLAHELAADTPEESAPTLSHDELVERFVEEFEAEILEDPEETS